MFVIASPYIAAYQDRVDEDISERESCSDRERSIAVWHGNCLSIPMPDVAKLTTP